MLSDIETILLINFLDQVQMHKVCEAAAPSYFPEICIKSILGRYDREIEQIHRKLEEELLARHA